MQRTLCLPNNAGDRHVHRVATLLVIAATVVFARPAEDYRLDPQRFGVWGSSAGGHLVALVGTSGDVKAFDVGAHLDQSSRVQAVCDFFGPTDFVVFVTTPGYERHATAHSPEAKLIGGAVVENKAKAGLANPIAHVSQDDPAFLIVPGDHVRQQRVTRDRDACGPRRHAGGGCGTPFRLRTQPGRLRDDRTGGDRTRSLAGGGVFRADPAILMPRACPRAWRPPRPRPPPGC